MSVSPAPLSGLQCSAREVRMAASEASICRDSSILWNRAATPPGMRKSHALRRVHLFFGCPSPVYSVHKVASTCATSARLAGRQLKLTVQVT